MQDTALEQSQDGVASGFPGGLIGRKVYVYNKEQAHMIAPLIISLVGQFANDGPPGRIVRSKGLGPRH